MKKLKEGPIQRGLARGFQASQAGGTLGSDSLERGIKNYFTNVKDEPKKSDTSKKQEPAVKVKQQPNTIIDNNNIPDMTAYKDLKTGMLFSYDDSQKKWFSRDGKVELSAKDGATGYNRAKEKSKLESKAIEDNKMKKVNEGLAELAGVAEKDHEVQMARADLYKIAKYAIKLHDMLKGVSETEGLEGWQQAKITKASDYISSVYHNLDYSMKFGEQQLPESDKKKAKKSKSAYTKPVAESNDPYKKKLAERLAKKIS